MAAGFGSRAILVKEAPSPSCFQNPLVPRFLVRTPSETRAVAVSPLKMNQPNPKSPHAMKKILIIEDDGKIAAALAIRLKSAGYHPIIASDGFEGLKRAVNDRPDLILMDIWMPVGIGFSVAQRLPSLGVKDIPVIFITASKLAGLRKTARQLGAVAFFEKPYDPEQLLAAIAHALSGHSPSAPEPAEDIADPESAY